MKKGSQRSPPKVVYQKEEQVDSKTEEVLTCSFFSVTKGETGSGLRLDHIRQTARCLLKCSATYKAAEHEHN